MSDNFLEDLIFNLTPEEKESQRLFEEKRLKERKEKIKESVKLHNLKVSVREYQKVTEGNQSKQKFTLFLVTSKGVDTPNDTLGLLDFVLYENVNLKDVFVCAKREGIEVSTHLNKLLHLDKIQIYSNYKNFGLASLLLDYFFDMYIENYKEYPMSVEFINPIAEYSTKKALIEKGLEHIINDDLFHRYYDSESDEKVISLLKEKNNNIFPLDSSEYILKKKQPILNHKGN